MKKLLLALALLLLPSAALAQCNGVFPNNTACGNITGASNTPRPIPLSSFPTSTPGGLTGNVQTNGGSGTFAGITNTQLTALLNVFTSTLSGAVSASGGGTTNFLRADGAWSVPTGGGGLISTTNGGTGFNNSTNNQGDVLVSTGTNGNFAHTAFNTVCGIVPTVCTAMIGHVDIAWYGAFCNNVNDDTVAIQNAWNAAAAASTYVWLGGDTISGGGSKCKISSLTMPTPTASSFASGFGEASAAMLKGPGSSQVMLVSNVTGTTCAITISATYGTNSSLVGKMEGFGLVQSAQNQAGDGICLNGITKLTFEDVLVNYFGVGFNANDTILLNIEKSWFAQNTVQISGQQVSNSSPNGWNIKNSHFSNSGQYSIRLGAPCQVNIEGNDFESEGIPNGTSSAQVFVTSLCPSSGALGANVVGNYFEGNTGFNLFLTQGTQTLKSIHNFNNNIVARSLANQSGSVLISNSSAGAGALMYVNAGGNSFFDVSTGTNNWLLATSSGATNYLISCAEAANIFVPATNVNSNCILVSTGFR